MASQDLIWRGRQASSRSITHRPMSRTKTDSGKTGRRDRNREGQDRNRAGQDRN